MEKVKIDVTFGSIINFHAVNKPSEKIIAKLKVTNEVSYIRTKFGGFPRLKNALFIQTQYSISTL